MDTPNTLNAPPLWELNPREACRRWLRHHEHLAYAPHSIEQYAAMTGAAADWLQRERGRSLLQAHAGDVDALLSSLRGRGGKTASVATTKRYVAVLRLVLSHLHTLGLRSDDPSTSLTHPAARHDLRRQAPRFLSPDQVTRYIDWVLAQPRPHWGDVRDAALRLLYLATGITVQESRQLLIHDVLPDDVPEPQVRIRAVSSVLARSIPLPPWCCPVLREWQHAHAQLALEPALAFPARQRSPVLAHHGSRARPYPISTSEIYDTIRPAMLAAGFDDEQQGPQTLRNTYAVTALALDVPMEVLQRRMGLHTPWSLDVLKRELKRSRE
ncbi:hypothetical protein VITFI_CDS3278 (plasmid) [Vitreoscilla filiformis]|uniref:Integrase n=1 Tax=Vitreoscilla filiformis TaxID=63 RepID=A0A221KJA4_VITFI|nr:tyrosine-type recombinase/integrase [Vitreoscilla filiformis]ASM79055.1 hypothetical protein VITFI_CDS3278 [Vitreoscilla filiformis]